MLRMQPGPRTALEHGHVQRSRRPEMTRLACVLLRLLVGDRHGGVGPSRRSVQPLPSSLSASNVDLAGAACPLAPGGRREPIGWTSARRRFNDAKIGVWVLRPDPSRSDRPERSPSTRRTAGQHETDRRSAWRLLASAGSTRTPRCALPAPRPARPVISGLPDGQISSVSIANSVVRSSRFGSPATTRNNNGRLGRARTVGLALERRRGQSRSRIPVRPGGGSRPHVRARARAWSGAATAYEPLARPRSRRRTSSSRLDNGAKGGNGMKELLRSRRLLRSPFRLAAYAATLNTSQFGGLVGTVQRQYRHVSLREQPAFDAVSPDGTLTYSVLGQPGQQRRHGPEHPATTALPTQHCLVTSSRHARVRRATRPGSDLKLALGRHLQEARQAASSVSIVSYGPCRNADPSTAA